MIKKPLIFVCSPLRGAGFKQNQSNAAKYSRLVAMCDGIPITPHIYFTQFFNDSFEQERFAGINLGLDALVHCPQIWVFSRNITVGMRIEINRAKELHMPIHFFDEECNTLLDSELDRVLAHDYRDELPENSEENNSDNANLKETTYGEKS